MRNYLLINQTINYFSIYIYHHFITVYMQRIPSFPRKCARSRRQVTVRLAPGAVNVTDYLKATRRVRVRPDFVKEFKPGLSLKSQ